MSSQAKPGDPIFEEKTNEMNTRENSKDNMSNEQVFLNTYTDPRRRAMEIFRRLWIIVAGIVAGIALGLIVYYAWGALTSKTVYSSLSEFYLDFSPENSGAYDYYNGYTWNDLMTTDPIANHTLENLNTPDIDITYLENVTEATIMSDIRLLHVTITESSEERCAQIQKATEDALVTFGDEAKEFDKISVIKSTAPWRVYADNRTMQAMILGGILGIVISAVAVGFMVVLDDRICFTNELYFLGIKVSDSLSGENGKNGAASYQEPDADKVRGSGAEGMTGASEQIKGTYTENVVRINASDITRDGTPSLDVHPGDEVVIDIPYRKVHLTLLVRLIEQIKAAGARVSELHITDVDLKAWKLYYFGRK